MRRNEIYDKLKGILQGSQFLLSDETLSILDENTSFIYDLVFDSIQILELFITMEEEFGIVCEPNDLNVELFDKVGSLLDFLEKKLA